MTISTATTTFYQSSIGKKTVMAVTGFLLFIFVVIHMIGNLQVFEGPEKINSYAVFLRKFPSLLWIARAGLFISVVLHSLAGIQLKLQNWRSRGARYTVYTPIESTWSSRNMIWTGLMIVSFVVYHLLQFTFGTVLPGFIHLDPYHNLVLGFSYWPVSAVYGLSMVLLGLHLYHGVWSMFQSMGLNAPRYDGWRRVFATGITVVLVGGNLSMPVAVLAGWIK